MATQATLKRQIKALQSTVRGGWVKFQGSYHTNAFEAVYTQTSGDAMSITTLSDYQVSITKDNGRWLVYAEDHNAEDLNDQPEDGFRTLAEAKVFAERFGEWFEQLWKENEGLA